MHLLLRSAHVELLHVAIAQFFPSDDPDEIVDFPRYSKPPPDVSVAEAETLARGWAQTCLSIRTVAFTIAQVGHTVCSVERVDGVVRVARLGSFEGRRVLEEEAKRCSEK